MTKKKIKVIDEGYQTYKIRVENGLFGKEINNLSKSDLEDILSQISEILNENFLLKLKKIQPDIHNKIQLLSNYESKTSPIEIMTKHGVCLMQPRHLLAGTSPNIQNAIDKEGYLISGFNEVHGNKYDYSKVKYTKTSESVIIICKTHGEFLQSIQSHQKGHGCKECAFRWQWGCDNWIKRAEVSKFFDGYKLYKLRCWNDKEEFYKIGITYKKIRERFCGVGNMPYNYEVLEVIELDDGVRICELETNLLKEHRLSGLSYSPKISFGGETECFSKLL